MSDFDTFWSKYPRKVGKGDARKAFAKAMKLTDMETILAAIDRYKSQKPDWLHFKHPATWLNKECWEDEWDEPKKPQTGGAPRSFDYKPKDNVVHLQTGNTVFLRAWEAQKKTGGE